MTLHSLPEHAALVFQQRLRRLPILWREVISVLRKPLSCQNMLQNDQHSQVLLRLGAEEGRNPAERFRPIGTGLLKGLNPAQVVVRAAPRFVKGKVDDQLP